ncbi:hypothetical protein ACFRFJ_21280 [Streptomyces hydrogenans]
MNTLRHAARAVTAPARIALALLGSTTLLTFGTSVREIFGVSVGIGA